MEQLNQIASFSVNHNTLLPGLYFSRQDGNVITYDLRCKKPNTGDLLTNAQMHSAEHLIATLLRNSEHKDAVIYFGPMGCQTGFYFLFDGNQLTHAQAIELLQYTFAQGATYTGDMPGYSAVECGNYINLDVACGREVCRQYYNSIADWTEPQLAY